MSRRCGGLLAEVRLGGSSGPVVRREGACWGLPECRGGYPGGGINPARVSRCGGGGSGRCLPPSPRGLRPSPRGLSALPSFLPLAGFKSLVDLPSSVLPSLAQWRRPSSRWVRPPPPLLAGGWPLSGLSCPTPVGVVFSRRLRGLLASPGGSGGFPVPRRCASLLCAWGGARCGLRPPVSPCRTRRCAVSRRGQLGPGVVSRRERVRLAAARRGCRRAPTGGLSRARLRRPPPARPGGGRWCGE